MATAAQKPNGSGDERPRGGEGPARGGRDRARTSRQLGESVRALERDGRELLSAIEQLSASAGDALREQMNRRPYAALGAGLLAGYVLGGGLSLRLATVLAGMAGRATVAQLLARGLGAGARGGVES